MILDFAEDNPPLPLNKMGVKYLSPKDLPTEVSAELKSLKQAGVYKQIEITKIEKRWPAFARGVTEIIRKTIRRLTTNSVRVNLMTCPKILGRLWRTNYFNCCRMMKKLSFS